MQSTVAMLWESCNFKAIKNKGGDFKAIKNKGSDDTKRSCRLKEKSVRRRLEPEMRMVEDEKVVEVPVNKSMFAKMLAMQKVPVGLKRDGKIRKALVEMAMRGDDLIDSSKGLVMVIDRENYSGCGGTGALVFQCSECSYVGERYYHAGNTVSLLIDTAAR